MDIVFSINDNSEVMVLPISPEIEISEDQANETFEGLSFNFRLIGLPGLRSFEIESFFPGKKYDFANPYSEVNPDAYVDFFQRIKKERIPARVVITDKFSKEFLNMTISVDSFNYKKRSNGDIDYTLAVTEYPIL